MTTHAIAFVEWNNFRSGGKSTGALAYDFGSDKKILHTRVGNGGTLWLITSTKKKNKSRQYHLAYKLVNCKVIAPEESVFSSQWDYVVRARDFNMSQHFPSNNATDTLKRLQFTYGKSMKDSANYGMRLVSIPELTVQDVRLLENLELKIRNNRNVFISYSHKDMEFTNTLEDELSKCGVHVGRDVKFLMPGQEWDDAIRKELESTDCFLVLISPNSADSKEIRKEVNFALSEYNANGLVKSIVPVVLSEESWNEFPELHRFERWDYPVDDNSKQIFNRLAEGIILTAR